MILRTKHNIVENLLEDNNNQLQAHCVELVSHKQALQKKYKDMATMKTQLLKLQTKNKHLVVKSVEAERVIKKAKAMQLEYNELNHTHFKTYNDLKALQTNFNQLTRDYGKMEAITI